MRTSDAAIVLYSISSRQSFREVTTFVHQFERVKGIHGAENLIISIVGNKSDRFTEREVSSAEGYDLGRQLGHSFSECSVLQNKDNHIEQIFSEVVRQLRKRPLPQQESDVKEVLAQIATTEPKQTILQKL